MMLANVSVPLFCGCIGASLYVHCVFPYFCSKKNYLVHVIRSFQYSTPAKISNLGQTLLDNTNDMLLLMGNYV